MNVFPDSSPLEISLTIIQDFGKFFFKFNGLVKLLQVFLQVT